MGAGEGWAREKGWWVEKRTRELKWGSFDTSRQTT